jgi:hypothetical protein
MVHLIPPHFPTAGESVALLSLGVSDHRDLKAWSFPSGNKGRTPSGEIGGKAMWCIPWMEQVVNRKLTGSWGLDLMA